MKSIIGFIMYGRVGSQGFFYRLLGIALAGLNMVGAGAGIRKSGEALAIQYALAKDGEFPIVFDAGAQGGEYLEIALDTNKNVRVYAFEPAEDAFKWLKERNYPQNISVLQAGLGEKNGELELYSAEGVRGVDSFIKLPDTKHNTFKASGKVPVFSVDSFCEERGIKFVNILKLDIEGGEYDALKGAKGMIQSRSIQFIQFEHSSHASDAGYKFKDVFDMLSPNYRIYRILQHGLFQIQEATILQEMPFAVNYLAELR